jgi:hypothetical protein
MNQKSALSNAPYPGRIRQWCASLLESSAEALRAVVAKNTKTEEKFDTLFFTIFATFWVNFLA